MILLQAVTGSVQHLPKYPSLLDSDASLQALTSGHHTASRALLACQMATHGHSSASQSRLAS